VTAPLVINNVALPITLDDAFIPPDLEKALEYYPDFIRASRLHWSPQAYLSAILHCIDDALPGGYDGMKAFGEFLSYVGLRKFGEYMGVRYSDAEWLSMTFLPKTDVQ
jgi:hypothetical protein